MADPSWANPGRGAVGPQAGTRRAHRVAARPGVFYRFGWGLARPPGTTKRVGWRSAAVEVNDGSERPALFTPVLLPARRPD